ncbi:hypothetical protein WA026_001160 [Henosepilachna vigintioctopunctata]|uniref:Ig-like domain-containing protein n=1 Tax=Henosepilachna vigintioctopunctata TaxID=420089 RepID=A0AAW1UZX4_9CUCU
MPIDLYEEHQHLTPCATVFSFQEIASVIAQPAIRRAEYSSDEVGGTISLECNVEKRAEVQVTLYWTNPRGIKNETDGLQATLFIENITSADQGDYICNARDRQGHQSKASIYYRIYGKNEHFINLISEESKTSSDQIEAGTPEVLWEVNMDAHPAPTITWINNKNQIITDTKGKKYQIYMSATKLTLTIKNITLFDYGKYILKAQNNRNDEKILEFFLNVTGKPYVRMDTNQNYQLHNELVFVSCNVKANPAAEISWNFKPCLDDSCDYEKLNILATSTHLGGLDFSYEIKVTFNKSGIIKCSADNSMGHGDIMKPIYVCDITNCFGIVVLNEDVSYEEMDENKTIIRVAEGESLSLSCRAQLQNSQHEIRWSYSSDIINPSEKYRIQKNYSEFSNNTDLTINEVSYRDNGFYECKIYDNTDNNSMEKLIKKNMFKSLFRNQFQRV